MFQEYAVSNKAALTLKYELVSGIQLKTTKVKVQHLQQGFYKLPLYDPMPLNFG